MADRAHSTSRRTLLAAPVLMPIAASAGIVPITPAAADPIPLPAVPGACFHLGRQAERIIREHQAVDRQDYAKAGEGWEGHCRRLRELSAEVEALQDSILRTRAATALDVLAKLLVANVAIGRAKNDESDRESCEQAEDAVRDCVIAVAELTGASLIELGADWTDDLLRVRLEPELRRVLPAIYGA